MCMKDLNRESTKWEQCVHQFLSSIWLPGAQVVHRLALAPAHQCEGRSHPFCISPLSHLINWVTKMPMECIMQDPRHQHTQSFLNSFLFFFEALSPSLSLAVSCILRMCTSSLFAYAWYSWQARQERKKIKRTKYEKLFNNNNDTDDKINYALG